MSRSFVLRRRRHAQCRDRQAVAIRAIFIFIFTCRKALLKENDKQHFIRRIRDTTPSFPAAFRSFMDDVLVGIFPTTFADTGVISGIERLSCRDTPKSHAALKGHDDTSCHCMLKFFASAVSPILLWGVEKDALIESHLPAWIILQPGAEALTLMTSNEAIQGSSKLCEKHLSGERRLDVTQSIISQASCVAGGSRA